MQTIRTEFIPWLHLTCNQIKMLVLWRLEWVSMTSVLSIILFIYGVKSNIGRGRTQNKLEILKGCQIINKAKELGSKVASNFLSKKIYL